MDPIILQDKFISLLPINGDMCKDILKQIDSDYKENDNYINECIYVGHCEIIDYETGFKAKSRPKVGKSKYLNALIEEVREVVIGYLIIYILFPKKKTIQN